mgnify:FL=1
MSKLKALKSLLKSASGFGAKDSVRGFASAHPLAAFGLVAPTVGFGVDAIARPAIEGLSETAGITGLMAEPGNQREHDEYTDDRGYVLADKLKSARIEEMVQRNMAVVQKQDPHLYNQVMSGRILPKGAVVLGGPRRQDLMEELAYSMGTSSSPEEFSSLLS